MIDFCQFGAVGIDDDAQPRIRMAGDISRVDRADAARAERAAEL